MVFDDDDNQTIRQRRGGTVGEFEVSSKDEVSTSNVDPQIFRYNQHKRAKVCQINRKYSNIAIQIYKIYLEPVENSDETTDQFHKEK